MNLVAKEFVAAQVAEPGVLVLSRLAGATETMREAIHVNPYDIDGTARALHRALTMEDTERRSRLAALRRRERRDDVYAWLGSFLAATRATAVDLRPPSARDFEMWFGSEGFFEGHSIAVFLDYDGTLAPICEHPADAVMPAGMRLALKACIDRKEIDVSIVSGRKLSDVESLVNLPGLTYAGSHGMEIRFRDLPEFRHEDLAAFSASCEALAGVLAETAPAGAWTERKGATLTFHYRQVAPAEQEAAAARVRALIREAGFQTRDAQCAVEGLPPLAWDKGRAVLHVLRTRFGPHWPEHARAIYVGDDKTDEDAFRILAGLGMTIRVGRSDTPTAALRRLPNVEGVQAFLEWLAERAGDVAKDAAQA
jgi:trehalose-phosphatase